MTDRLGCLLLVTILVFAGCASVPSTAPEVAHLQALADSIQPGWRVEPGWSQRGYLGTMVGAPVSGPARWLNAGNPCVGCPTYMWPTIYLRDEVVGTKCADVIIAGLFARHQSKIPFTFGQPHVNKETVKLLVERGWTEDTVKSAWGACPTVLSE